MIKLKGNTTTTAVETIECPPHWPGVFDYASNIARSEIPADAGREIVLEMLAYGKRLCEAQEK